MEVLLEELTALGSAKVKKSDDLLMGWAGCCRPYTLRQVFHHLYIYIYADVLSRGLLFVTPWTVAHQASLFMGFSRQEYWSGLPCPPPGDLPHPGTEFVSLCLLQWQVDSLPLAPPEKPHLYPALIN